VPEAKDTATSADQDGTLNCATALYEYKFNLKNNRVLRAYLAAGCRTCELQTRQRRLIWYEFQNRWIILSSEVLIGGGRFRVIFFGDARRGPAVFALRSTSVGRKPIVTAVTFGDRNDQNFA
jgi:hypothetical protein